MNYNTTYEVVYSNDQEYRQCLREVLRLNLSYSQEKIQQLLEATDEEEFDSETEDEMLFDETTAAIMNFIFEKTKDQPEFRELYLMAAAKLISENISIGMTICFSYDYFYLFHQYLVIFLVENRIDREKYNELKTLLG
jgi:hypothetical protein